MKRINSTVEFYDRNALDWAREHKGFDKESYWNEQVVYFNSVLPWGKILEIGSGSGKDAQALINLGYDYTGCDASVGLLDIARKRNPRGKFVNCMVDSLPFKDEEFNGFWTAATLLHVPKDQIDTSLKSIYRVTKPGGVGFISMKAGAGEKTDTETGRWFSYYSKEGFGNVLERNNFSILNSETKKGEKDWWLIYFVRKN